MITTTKTFQFRMSNLKMYVDIRTNIEVPHPQAKDELVPFLHYHTMYEIFTVSDEPLSILTEKGTTTYKNCILCIPPLFKHLCLSPTMQCFFFSYRKSDAKNDGFSNFIERSFNSSQPFVFPASEQALFYRNELCNPLYYDSDDLPHELGISLLKLFFSQLYSQKELKQNTQDSYLILLDSFFNTYYHDDCRMQDLAESLHLSPRQVARLIKKYYNTTFSDFLTKKRLDLACALLTKTDKSINEIVELIHFSSESYFFAQFKKALHLTPKQYRDKYTERYS